MKIALLHFFNDLHISSAVTNVFISYMYHKEHFWNDLHLNWKLNAYCNALKVLERYKWFSRSTLKQGQVSINIAFTFDICNFINFYSYFVISLLLSYQNYFPLHNFAPSKYYIILCSGILVKIKIIWFLPQHWVWILKKRCSIVSTRIYLCFNGFTTIKIKQVLLWLPPTLVWKCLPWKISWIGIFSSISLCYCIVINPYTSLCFIFIMPLQFETSAGLKI